MSDQSFTVSDYLICRLHEQGVQQVHALPGDYTAGFLNALERGSSLTRIAHCNELVAGYAADASARHVGLSALCLQYGVGTYSALNAVAGAYQERAPIVVITGSPSAKARALMHDGLIFHHSTVPEMTVGKAVFEKLTVAAEVISDVSQAALQIDKALVAALSACRPVYIEVWENLWSESCRSPVGTLGPEPRQANPAALADALDEAWARIDSATTPVIWGGAEVQRFGLQSAFAELLEASNLPFVTTILGKTLLSENHPNYAGTFAAGASLPAVRELMNHSDCVIGFGTLLIDYYRGVVVKDYSSMIQADDAQVRIGNHIYPDVDMRSFLIGLVARFRSDGPAPPRDPMPVPSPALPAAPDIPITYDHLFARMQEFLDDSMVVVPDLSASMFVSANLRISRAEGYLANANWASIGYATAAAIGVALCGQGRPVVFAGDGGFQMVAQAISTHVTAATRAIVFVMNNGTYAIEQAFTGMDAYTGDAPFNPYNVLPHWDYVALAQSMGATAQRVATMGDLEGALSEARRAEEVYLIEVRIPKRDLPIELLRLVEGFKKSKAGP